MDLYYIHDLINQITNLLVFVVICLIFYQVGYLINGFKKEKKIPHSNKLTKFACLIPARYESRVIKGILDSLDRQTYNKDFFDAYIIVESLEDETVKILENYRYKYVLRKDLEGRKTKGYALDDCIKYLEKNHLNYDSMLIFDADNILSEDYIEKMNDLRQTGVKVGMGYRHSNNARANWVSACSETLFLVINTFISKPKSKFQKKLLLSGTGYFIDYDLIQEAGGFIWNGLTEDNELTIWCYTKNVYCRYTSSAVFYDEQPTDMSVARKQHIRWVWGFFIANKKFGKNLRKSIRSEKKGRISKVEFVIGIWPIVILLVVTILNVLVSLSFSIYGYVNGLAGSTLLLINGLVYLLDLYLVCSFSAILTLIADYKNNEFTNRDIIKISLLFPFFLFDFIIAFFLGLNKKNLTWKPIEHKGQ